MSKLCTCTKDKEMTCIVHPTQRALKARIEELEAENQRLREISEDSTLSWQEKHIRAYRILHNIPVGGSSDE